MSGGDGFDVVARGYDRRQVDQFLWRLTLPTERLPDPDFKVVFRGYDRDQVDAHVREALTARRAGELPEPPERPERPERPESSVPEAPAVPAGTAMDRPPQWRAEPGAEPAETGRESGRGEVDRLLSAFFDDKPPVMFDVAFRGYDRHQVDAYVTTVLEADPDEPAPILPPIFDVVFRGYDRDQVDHFVQEHRHQSHGGSYGSPGT